MVHFDILRLNRDNGGVRDLVADTLSGTVQVTLKSCVINVGYESLEGSRKRSLIVLNSHLKIRIFLEHPLYNLQMILM